MQAIFVFLLSALADYAIADVTVSAMMTNTWALSDSECYAPTEEGGWGYCGAPTCRHQYTTCPAEGGGPPTVDGVSGSFRSDVGDESNCISFLDMSDTEDVSDWGFRGACTSDCTQRTDGVCDGALARRPWSRRSCRGPTAPAPSRTTCSSTTRGWPPAAAASPRSRGCHWCQQIST